MTVIEKREGNHHFFYCEECKSSGCEHVLNAYEKKYKE